MSKVLLVLVALAAAGVACGSGVCVDERDVLGARGVRHG